VVSVALRNRGEARSSDTRNSNATDRATQAVQPAIPPLFLVNTALLRR